MASRVLTAEVSGGRVRGRPRLGWMDGVKVAFGNTTQEWRWKPLFNARKIGKSGEPWYICNWMSFTLPVLLDLVFFRTALPCCGGYHLENSWMPLHDAIGINCKNSRRRCQVYRLRGECLMFVCVLSDLTWSPLLGGGRKSWYIIICLI